MHTIVLQSAASRSCLLGPLLSTAHRWWSPLIMCRSVSEREVHCSWTKGRLGRLHAHAGVSTASGSIACTHKLPSVMRAVLSSRMHAVPQARHTTFSTWRLPVAMWCRASSMCPSRMASLRRLVLLPVRACSRRARSVAALLCALLTHCLQQSWLLEVTWQCT